MMSPDRAHSELQSMLDEAPSLGIPGISVAIATRHGLTWTGASGVANLQSAQPVTANMLFGIGSITKTFVAVVILQLVEEGRLDLQDTPVDVLNDAVTDIANVRQATIPQLLNHTGGVPSWEDDPNWIRDGRGARLDVDHPWGKTDALDYVRGHAPLAAPGEKYSYSNTNYTLLGMMIEKVTGVDAADEIRRRILHPLGLKDIYLEGFEPVPVHRLPHRYHRATPAFRRDAGVNAAFPEVRPELIDATRSNLSVEWAAGGMLATARDLALYGTALRDGKLLQSQSMQLMTRWYPTGKDAIQVGHNVFRWGYPEGLAHIGHNGDVLGFSAALYWLESADAVAAALCNVGTMHSGEIPIGLYSIVKSREFLERVVRLTNDH
jgi:D-alanyl-D-alanine carboxypeptidase